MKKIIWIVIALISAKMGQAQSIAIDKNIRMELCRFFSHESTFPDQEYDDSSLIITNLLSSSNECPSNDKYKNGIYSFEVIGSHQYKYILLKNIKEFKILRLSYPTGTRDFSDVLNELLDYFDQNKDLDRRLLPFYTKAIADCYIYNTRIAQMGNWFEWYDKDYKQYTDKIQY